VNRGRLGPKDLFGWQAIGNGDRLRRPLIQERGALVETDWETAMGRIVERAQALLDRPADGDASASTRAATWPGSRPG